VARKASNKVVHSDTVTEGAPDPTLGRRTLEVEVVARQPNGHGLIALTVAPTWQWQGHTIGFSQAGPEGDTPDRSTVILIHGFGACSAPLASQLAGAG